MQLSLERSVINSQGSFVLAICLDVNQDRRLCVTFRQPFWDTALRVFTQCILSRHELTRARLWSEHQACGCVCTTASPS